MKKIKDKNKLISLHFKNEIKRIERLNEKRRLNYRRLQLLLPPEERLKSHPQIKKDYSRSRKKLYAPSVFSILKNTEEMVYFFDELSILLQKRNKIFLDLSEITEITSDAIIYMLSLFEYFRKKNDSATGKMRGNFPTNSYCKDMLVESGFFDYVNPTYRFQKTNANILSFQSDKIVQPEIAKKVVVFAREKLNQERTSASKRSYEIIIECMGNTNDHAYVVQTF